MTDEPTVTGSGYAIRDAEARTSQTGRDYTKITLRGDVEDKPKDGDEEAPSAWFIEAMVFGPERRDAVAVREGALCSFSGRLLNRRRYKGRNGDEREAWTVLCNHLQSEEAAEAQTAIAEIRKKLKSAEEEARTARASERRVKKRCADLRAELAAAEQATQTAQAAEQLWRERADELERAPGRGGRRETVAQLLGLPSPITRKAVKAAKRNVAKTLHPDVCKGPLATTMMQFLNSALDDLERNL